MHDLDNVLRSPLDALDSGVEALSGESTLGAHDILGYLQTHPEFFAQYSEVLARLATPAQHERGDGLVGWPNHALRDRADQQQARMDHLLVQATHNQKNHDKLFGLVAGWLATVDAQALPVMIMQDLRTQFGLDAVQVIVWHEISQSVLFPSQIQWPDHVVVFANSLRLPYCGLCKGFELESLLAQQSPTGKIASLAIIPLWGKRGQKFECMGVLLFGASDAQRFSPEMGTQFLQQIGEMAGAALSRLPATV